jgi:hypothetical protein
MTSKNKPASPPPPDGGSAKRAVFPVRIGELFNQGIKGFKLNALPLVVAGSVVLGIVVATYGTLGLPSQQPPPESILRYVGLTLAGLILAGTLSYPWYYWALQSARGEKASLAAPFADGRRFLAMAVSSFWFWVGMLFGIQYFWGLPSILILVLYAFHGYVIAAGKAKHGLLALGTSVRLGEKRRIGLLAVAALFALLNFCGAIASGFELGLPLKLALTILGLAVTTSITLVAGGVLFDVLWELMGDDKAPQRQSRGEMLKERKARQIAKQEAKKRKKEKKSKK